MNTALEDKLHQQAAAEAEKAEIALIRETEAALLLLKNSITRLKAHRRNFGYHWKTGGIDADYLLVSATLHQCEVLLTSG
jgi:hypothetical protein